MKKKKPGFFDYLSMLFVFLLGATVLFLMNPYRYLFYALVIGGAVFAFKNKVWINPKKWLTEGLTVCGIVYLILISLLSVSPWLQVTEFRLSHWNWRKVSGNTKSIHPDWDGGYRRAKGYAYADVFYSYVTDYRHFENVEKKAVKRYYPFFKSDSTMARLQRQIAKTLEDAGRKNSFIIFYRIAKPAESKLFVDDAVFEPRGSMLYGLALLMILFILALILIFISFLFSKKQQ